MHRFFFLLLLLLGLSGLLPAQFLRQYGTSVVDEIGKVMLPERNTSNALTGNIYIGGNRAGKTLIMLVNPLGQILGQWSFKACLPGESENLSDLIYDRTLQNLVGTGFVPSGGNNRAYVFRFNLATHTVQWSNRFVNESVIAQVIDRGAVTAANAPIIHLFGMTYQPGPYNSNYLEMNLNTGAILSSTDRIDHSTGPSDHFAAYWDAPTASFMATGRWGDECCGSSFRPSLYKMDGHGNKTFLRTHLLGLGASARIYAQEIVRNAAGEPVVLSSGDFTGSNTTTNTNFAIARLNPADGTVLWAARFDITNLPGPGEWAMTMLINSSGNYLVAGNTTGMTKQLFLTEITPTGLVLWAHTYQATGSNYMLNFSKGQLQELNGSYYLLSQVDNGGQRDIQLIRTNLLGQMPGCTTPNVVIAPPILLTASQTLATTLSGTNSMVLSTPTVATENMPSSVSCPTPILPEASIALMAEAGSHELKLSWGPDFEDTDSFEIVVAQAAGPFERVARLGPDERQYAYAVPASGTYFAQVAAQRHDGTTVHSETKMLKMDLADGAHLTESLLHVGDEAHVRFQGDPGSTVALNLYDVSGHLVAAQSLVVDASGSMTASLSTSGLRRGMYFVQVAGQSLRLVLM